MTHLVQTTRESVLTGEKSSSPQSVWYAGYTYARHEKRVAEQLQERSVEHFLPLYNTIHHWKNGRHHVQLPLFPGYIFVRIVLSEKLRVLEVPGFVHLVEFGGVPFPLSDSEIVGVREALNSGLVAEPHPYLTVGARVEIVRGPLQGMTGILRRKHGQCRVVLSIDLIMRSIAVDVDASEVIPLSTSKRLNPEALTTTPSSRLAA